MRAHPRFIRFFALLLVPSCLALQTPQDVSSANVFLEGAYKHYAHNAKGIDVNGPEGKHFFHSSLLSLIKADEKAADGDIPAIEGDPICSCQDWGGIWDLKIAIQMQGSDRANATVSFSLRKERTKDDLRTLDFTLSLENGQWRIYDIVDKSDTKAPFALRAELIKDIRAHTRPPVSKPAH